MLKGNSATAAPGPFTLEGGNAQSGALTTIYDGAFPPPSYSPCIGEASSSESGMITAAPPEQGGSS